MRETGLAKVLAGVGDSGNLVLCTREGLRAISRDELLVLRFCAGRVAHPAAVARVVDDRAAARRDRPGAQLVGSFRAVNDCEAAPNSEQAGDQRPQSSARKLRPSSSPVPK